MKKLLTGLGALVLSACAQTNYVPAPQEARKLTGHMVDEQQQYLQGAKSDNHYSRGEIGQIISRYDMMKKASMVDSAGDGEKALFAQVKKEYQGAVEDVFNHTDLYMGLTGTDTAEFQNVPANIGASKQLYLGKGEKHADKFTFEQKESIVRKARDAWRPYEVTQGVVQAGGGRIVGLEETAIEVGLDLAAKLLGFTETRGADGKTVTGVTGTGIVDMPTGYKNVNADLWLRMRNSNPADGEVSRGFVTAVAPNGYDFPKADKK